MEGRGKPIKALFLEAGERGRRNANIVHAISRVGLEGYASQFSTNKKELRRAIINMREVADSLEEEFLSTEDNISNK
jgi:hypothetical protein